MIKIIFKFVGGFVIGAFFAFLIVYAFGLLMENMNVSLYDSESDQQRNFNIFIGLSLVVALITGYLATKFGRKN
jgi:MFS family permease